MFLGRIFDDSIRLKPHISTIDNLSSFDINCEIQNAISEIINESYSIRISHIKDTYLYLRENNICVLEETYNIFITNVINFLDSLENIIKRFIKRSVSNDISKANEFERYLKANKESILNAKRKIVLNNGYNYTIPFKNQYTIDIIDKFNNELIEISSHPNKITKEFILKESEKYSNDYEASMRAKILGVKKSHIDYEDFISEVRKFYRDGKSDPVKIIIDEAFIKTIIEKYPEYKQVLITASNEYTILLNKINLIRKTFSTQIANLYDNKKGYDEETLSNLNEYYHLQFKKLSLIYSCVIHVYFEKINAIREYLLQSEKIIKFTLSNIDENIIDDEIDEVVTYD